jgi:hypothetical protein
VLWVVAIAAVLALIAVAVIEKVGKPAPMPYSAFLDQLDVGSVASITFQGTEIDGRFKRPLDSAIATGTGQQDTFSSRVPDFGDPTLIPELHKQHVVIDVHLATQWTRLFVGLPWPMLFILGAALIAGLVRLVRGGKAEMGAAMSMHPMHGMVGLVSGLFGKSDKDAKPPARSGGEAPPSA